jgi:hypothetical protein
VTAVLRVTLASILVVAVKRVTVVLPRLAVTATSTPDSVGADLVLLDAVVMSVRRTSGTMDLEAVNPASVLEQVL